MSSGQAPHPELKKAIERKEEATLPQQVQTLDLMHAVSGPLQGLYLLAWACFKEAELQQLWNLQSVLTANYMHPLTLLEYMLREGHKEAVYSSQDAVHDV